MSKGKVWVDAHMARLKIQLAHAKKTGETHKNATVGCLQFKWPHKYTTVLLITTTLYLMLYANKNTAAVRMK